MRSTTPRSSRSGAAGVAAAGPWLDAGGLGAGVLSSTRGGLEAVSRADCPRKPRPRRSADTSIVGRTSQANLRRRRMPGWCRRTLVSTSGRCSQTRASVAATSCSSCVMAAAGGRTKSLAKVSQTDRCEHQLFHEAVIETRRAHAPASRPMARWRSAAAQPVPNNGPAGWHALRLRVPANQGYARAPLPGRTRLATPGRSVCTAAAAAHGHVLRPE